MKNIEKLISSEKMFETEKELLNKLKNVKNPNPYIINIIDSSKGEISRTERITKTNNYIILDYVENVSLYDYIYYHNILLNEDLFNLLFYKIFNAIKICHDAKICNYDIK